MPPSHGLGFRSGAGNSGARDFWGSLCLPAKLPLVSREWKNGSNSRRAPLKGSIGFIKRDL